MYSEKTYYYQQSSATNSTVEYGSLPHYYLQSIAQALYALWTLFNFFWLMALCLPFIILPIMINEKKGGRIAFYFMRFWGFMLLALSGIRVKSFNKNLVDRNEAQVFIANHNSYMDSPALTLAIPEQFRALGKQEILKMPMFGFIFKYIGVTVDRSSMRSRIESIIRIKQKLDKKINVLIFPEGTMNRSEAPLLPFHDGAFLLAIKAGKPIVPTVVLGTRRILPRGTWRMQPGRVDIIFSEPIKTEGLKPSDLPKLKAEVEARMKSLLTY
ncbi:MAG: 1-acyl-sn-glycerol-3-phosphate acyltransferase [Bernardetiaceae bacterium]|nr:1-acyl-sn-glycerol-3-phosphate acyltransferase [Bernardetiaceae bacterium]